MRFETSISITVADTYAKEFVQIPKPSCAVCGLNTHHYAIPNPFNFFVEGIFLNVVSNQIKSLLLSHHHSTSALVSEILMSVLQTVQKNNNKKKQFTYGQYIFTDCTEDNVQNTHTYTQYTQCTIKTYLIINYTLCSELFL